MRIRNAKAWSKAANFSLITGILVGVLTPLFGGMLTENVHEVTVTIMAWIASILVLFSALVALSLSLVRWIQEAKGQRDQ